MQQVIDYRLHGPGEGRADFGVEGTAGAQGEVREPDRRHRRRDRLHQQHLRRREHRRDGPGPGEEEGQRRDRRAALHDLALHVQGAREAGRRASDRQASQLGDRARRHGQGDRPQHAARLAGAGVERQRVHARLQGGERPRPRARRARVRRHHPGGRRGAGRRERARHRLRVGRHLQVADGRARASAFST